MKIITILNWAYINIQSRPHKTARRKQQQSMTKDKELTDYQKSQIEGRSESKSHSEISKELNIPHRTMFNFLKRLKLDENKEIFHAPNALEKPPVLMIDILSIQLKQIPTRRWKNYAIRQILIFLFKQFGDDSIKQTFENGMLNNVLLWPRNRLHNDIDDKRSSTLRS